MNRSITDKAWSIAAKHVPYFETTWAPNRNAILAAVTEALRTPPPPAPHLDALINDIDRADARQGGKQ